jgi:hypothetical protein
MMNDEKRTSDTKKESDSARTFIKSTYEDRFDAFAYVVCYRELKRFKELIGFILPVPHGLRPRNHSVEDANDFLKWTQKVQDFKISFSRFRAELKAITNYSKKIRKKESKNTNDYLDKITRKDYLRKTINDGLAISRISMFSRKSSIDDEYSRLAAEIRNGKIISKLKSNPEIARLQCPKSKETMLHVALRMSASFDVIQELIERNPGAVSFKNINGAIPLDTIRQDHEISSKVCEYVYSRTRKILEPTKLSLASILLCNAPDMDGIINIEQQIDDVILNIEQQTDVIRDTDISVALRRLKDPSRVLVPLLLQSRDRINIHSMMKLLSETIDLDCDFHVVAMFTSILSCQTTRLKDTLQYALSKFNYTIDMKKKHSLIILLLLLVDPSAVNKTLVIPSKGDADVIKLLRYLKDMKMSKLEDTEATRIRSFKTASLIKTFFGGYREPAIDSVPIVKVKSKKDDEEKHEKENATTVCTSFELDLKHRRFNMCKRCGFGLEVHAKHRASRFKKKKKIKAPKQSIVRDENSWLAHRKIATKALQYQDRVHQHHDSFEKMISPSSVQGWDSSYRPLLAIVVEHSRRDTKQDGKKKNRKEPLIRSWKNLKELRVPAPRGVRLYFCFVFLFDYVLNTHTHIHTADAKRFELGHGKGVFDLDCTTV